MKGFYLAGSFDKGKKAQFMVLPQSQKLFRIDSLYGEIEPRGIPIFDRKKHYFFADEWQFIRDYSISEISEKAAKENPILANAIIGTLNEIWAGWCEKHKRKCYNLFEEVKS